MRRHFTHLYLLPAIMMLMFTPLCAEELLDLGRTHLVNRDYEAARDVFTKLNSSPDTSVAAIAVLALAKIDIEQNQLDHALQILNTPQGNLLEFERVYLLGLLHYKKADYGQAIAFFEKALPQKNHDKAHWYAETLCQLGWCHLQQANRQPQQAREQCKKALGYFEELQKTAPSDANALALASCLLNAAKLVDDPALNLRAEKILLSHAFETGTTKAHALLLLAQTAPDYAARDRIYLQLIENPAFDELFSGKGWLERGLNAYAEGPSHAEKAASFFDTAFMMLCEKNKELAIQAYLYKAQVLYNAGLFAKAFSHLCSFVEQHPDLLALHPCPDEIYYQIALAAAQQNQETERADRAIQQGLALYPNGKYQADLLFLQAVLLTKAKAYQQAEPIFMRVYQEHRSSPLAGTALFWAGSCWEQNPEAVDKKSEYYRKTFTEFPQNPLAAEAYFKTYSYREYLQGNREAIRHLQALPERFPDSPYGLNALFLLGLDYKRDRKSPEGKWITKHNWTAAIDSFQGVETLFDRLYTRQLLPETSRDYFTTIKYRATIERALANLKIAEEAQGAKRQIYLEYAEDVFHAIVKELSSSDRQGELYPPLLEEGMFGLAQTHIKSQDDGKAEKVLVEMLDHYNKAKITRGFFLSRVWYELSQLEMRRTAPELALDYLARAEDAAKGKVLSTDQKLDLWIQQSVCYKELQQWDKAMLTLSKVINENAVSGLRLKAMYLRAEIYELQKRSELAYKQLEALSLKGGEWGKLAKEKLDKEYGFH